jgi:hypothetical protein
MGIEDCDLELKGFGEFIAAENHKSECERTEGKKENQDFEEGIVLTKSQGKFSEKLFTNNFSLNYSANFHGNRRKISSPKRK